MTTKTYFIDSDNLYYLKGKRDSKVTQILHIKSINLQTEKIREELQICVLTFETNISCFSGYFYSFLPNFEFIADLEERVCNDFFYSKLRSAISI